MLSDLPSSTSIIYPGRFFMMLNSPKKQTVTYLSMHHPSYPILAQAYFFSPYMYSVYKFRPNVIKYLKISITYPTLKFLSIIMLKNKHYETS